MYILIKDNKLRIRFAHTCSLLFFSVWESLHSACWLYKLPKDSGNTISLIWTLKWFSKITLASFLLYVGVRVCICKGEINCMNNLCPKCLMWLFGILNFHCRAEERTEYQNQSDLTLHQRKTRNLLLKCRKEISRVTFPLSSQVP